MRRGREAPQGAVLLEVIIAIAILGMSGAAMAALAIDVAHVSARSAARENEVMQASAFLDHVTMWSAEELDRRLGDHEQGEWRLTIARPTPTVYEVGLRGVDGSDLLRTAVYRPLSAEAHALP